MPLSCISVLEALNLRLLLVDHGYTCSRQDEAPCVMRATTSTRKADFALIGRATAEPTPRVGRQS
jgi:hypothetical protein